MPGDTAHKMRINTEIFKAYDVRGLYPGEINEEVARQIGRGFVTYLGTRKIGVSRDMRVSSPGLAAAFIQGAREQGADVVDYGMLGTDMLPPPAAVPGSVSPRNIIFEYIEKVMSFIDAGVIKPFSVVLDAGSGMAGLVAPLLFDQLPCKTTKLCFDIDGTFPNHEANPLIEENRRDITEEVVRQKADVGIAWDGDADRCFFIDGSGKFITGDFITALLAEAFLLKHPGATIIYDLRASRAVKDTVERLGGRALMNRVGHAYIKRRMREEDGGFAGEVTGHYYFRDFSYADNGFIPALLILELMSNKSKSLHELLQPLRERYFISGEINTKLSNMNDVPKKLQAIEERYKDAQLARMDGISVDYPDWHFNVRGSNTEPLLRLNLEAATQGMMEKKRDEVLSIIRG